jgi:uncharacterized membrane protein SirB2
VFSFAEWLGGTSLSVGIQSRLWLTPLLQSIHIVMIGIVFTAMLIVALRVLGRVQNDEPVVATWQRFAPWFWGALVVMAITGLVLVIGEPVRQVTAMSFWFKMAFLAIGVGSAAYFGKVVRSSGGLGQPAGRARFVAMGTVALWLGIIFFGRAIAYDVEVWGSWHLG